LEENFWVLKISLVEGDIGDEDQLFFIYLCLLSVTIA